MKKVLLIIVAILAVAGATGMAKYFSIQQLDKRVAKFYDDADNLIMGLQQYKEFVGSYPSGTDLEIAKALLGQGQAEKKVMILSVRKNSLNSIGEVVDPWGTPVRFYFTQNGVLIRSAGVNKAFEDTKTFVTDDLFRSN